MLCPKCGREMTSGYLQTNGRCDIAWVSKLLPAGLGYWSNDALSVSTEKKLGVHALPAHICKSCRLFLGDYSQE